MRVLLVEDDPFVADLLETVISGLYAEVQVVVVDHFAEAEQSLDQYEFELLVTDWELPDGSGLDLVKQFRLSHDDIPVVMVSGRNDKASVLLAAQTGVNHYLAKPFTVELVRERLQSVLKDFQPPQELPAIEQVLSEQMEKVVQLPSDMDPQTVFELMDREEELSAGELADLWRSEVGLTARLLDVANSSSFKRSGEAVRDLKTAISSMGVPMALNQALALSLDASSQFDREALKEAADVYTEKSLNVATSAQQLALLLGFRTELFQKAGLLSRIGELAVLKVLQQYISLGGDIKDDEIETLVDQWAQEYGNKLKIEWNLPLELRELIGAVHYLAEGTVRKELLIMRAAALKAEEAEDDDLYLSLARRIGLSNEDNSHGAQRGN